MDGVTKKVSGTPALHKTLPCCLVSKISQYSEPPKNAEKKIDLHKEGRVMSLKNNLPLKIDEKVDFWAYRIPLILKEDHLFTFVPLLQTI